MIGFGLRFHHLGLATADEEASMAFLVDLGYTEVRQAYDPEQKVHCRLMRHDASPMVELLVAVDSPGPLDGVLKGARSALYHSCFACDDAVASLEAIREAGQRVLPVSSPKPAALFDMAPVSFHFVPSFGLIELLETSDRNL